MQSARSPSSISSTDYNLRIQDLFLGAQMLFVAFGALVLVPILTGLNPNVALLTAGVGTLIFQVITRGKVPVFLASSFAFIAPIQFGVQQWGLPATLCGMAAAGLVYVLLSLLVRWRGVGILLKILPPVVTGPVIMLIGLLLAPVAVSMATGGTESYSAGTAALVAASSLLATILIALLGRGILRLIPILLGITVGYAVALALGIVNFAPIAQAAWFAWPNFTFPVWSLPAILFMLPVAIAPAIEHFGDVVAISGVTGKNYLEDPGVDRTLLGDGIATTVAALVGGPPNTTYSEVTGAVTLTRVFNPAIMTWAAIVAVLLAFVGKLGAALATIPAPVMGGILILLFGSIAAVGMKILVRSQVDTTEPRNLIIIATILVFGIGGMQISFGDYALQGLGLAGIVGVLLNLVLPRRKAES